MISDDIIFFVGLNAGGYPVKDIVVINGEEYEVRVFLYTDRKDHGYCIENWWITIWEKIHGKIIPFGKESGDTHYCVNCKIGKGYYWTHIEGQNLLI